MKTIVILEIDHHKPIPALANLIAGRAYSIDGVTDAQLFRSPSARMDQLEDHGFSLDELRLGAAELVRT